MTAGDALFDKGQLRASQARQGVQSMPDWQPVARPYCSAMVGVRLAVTCLPFRPGGHTTLACQQSCAFMPGGLCPSVPGCTYRQCWIFGVLCIDWCRLLCVCCSQFDWTSQMTYVSVGRDGCRRCCWVGMSMCGIWWCSPSLPS